MSTKEAQTKIANPDLQNEDMLELVGSLNQLLAEYSVVYQKLRNFHWNVVGGEFYDVHEKLEEEYLAGAENIDQIAERVRVLGFKPLSTMAAFLEHSSIKETNEDLKAEDMIKMIISDYKHMIKTMGATVEHALEQKDYGTDFMVRNMIIRTEEKIWMFQSFVK